MFRPYFFYLLLQKEFKSIFNDGHIDFVADHPFEPSQRPEEKVNEAPKERAVNFIANHG